MSVSVSRTSLMSELSVLRRLLLPTAAFGAIVFTMGATRSTILVYGFDYYSEQFGRSGSLILSCASNALFTCGAIVAHLPTHYLFLRRARAVTSTRSMRTSVLAGLLTGVFCVLGGLVRKPLSSMGIEGLPLVFGVSTVLALLASIAAILLVRPSRILGSHVG